MKNIGVLVGSLRSGSYSKIVADKLIELLPEGYVGKKIDISNLNFYNEDSDTEDLIDESYKSFREELNKKDAVIFVTPEYNRSIPAVLKNAIDVASRPPNESKLFGKPALVVSLSIGSYGGFGANHHLRQTLVSVNMPVVQQPEIYLGKINQYIEDGKVSNPQAIETLQRAVDEFVKLIDKVYS